MSPSRLIDLEVRLFKETPGAILVSITDEPDDAVWVPKSVADWKMQRGSQTLCDLTIPEYIAIEKGLV